MSYIDGAAKIPPPLQQSDGCPHLDDASVHACFNNVTRNNGTNNISVQSSSRSNSETNIYSDNIISSSSANISPPNGVDPVNSSSKRRTLSSSHPDARRTSHTLLSVSVFYILTYIPHIAIIMVSLLTQINWDNFSPAAMLFFYNYVFLNSAVNPVIYSVCDADFRLRCMPTLRASRKKSRKDFRFDVFIGYADDDFYFVRFTLRKFLEDDLRLKTFVHQRDLLGGYIDQQFLDAIQVDILK